MAVDLAVEGARLRLLGGFRLADGAPEPPSRNGQRLLAVLGLRGPLTRTVVAGTLWPDATESRARGSLRTTLWRLEHGGHHEVCAHGDRLALAPGVDVDVGGLVGRARRVITGDRLRDADLDVSALGTGELLPGWLEEWVQVERERLRQLRLHGLEAAAAELRRRGRFAESVEVALAAVRIEPLRESAHGVLIATYLAEHNVVEAVRHLEHVRRLLRAELGVEPSPALTELVGTGATSPARSNGRHGGVTTR